MWGDTSARFNKTRGLHSLPTKAAKNKHIVFDNVGSNDSSDESTSETENFEKGKLKHERSNRATTFDPDTDSGEELYESKDLKQALKRKHTGLDEFTNDESESEISGSESDYEQGDDESDENLVEEDKDYSGMTMEELLKLQEEIGMKAFKEKVLKVPKSEKPESNEKKSFKRLNKNRPSEMPLMRKRAPPMNFMQPGKKSRKKIVRDPRFDDLSGNLQLDLWGERYKFLKDTRKKELEILKNGLQEETNPVKKEKLKKTIQRMENQQRESLRREQERAVTMIEKKHQREALKQGKKPRYMKNKDKKLLMKTMQFDELKKGNKVSKYLQRKEKKLAKKEKRQHPM
ncbi:ribosomal RNA processing protein 36 homolog [Palaemon carinicauda]|uniref:ribosomal RNA processing protein 36 homolog n=1 Tax=Palaemon carinicauda TaxID=392227 RepID=UPI0035B5F634